jgi:hypothetical protein
MWIKRRWREEKRGGGSIELRIGRGGGGKREEEGEREGSGEGWDWTATHYTLHTMDLPLALPGVCAREELDPLD